MNFGCTESFGPSFEAVDCYSLIIRLLIEDLFFLESVEVSQESDLTKGYCLATVVDHSSFKYSTCLNYLNYYCFGHLNHSNNLVGHNWPIAYFVYSDSA